MELTISRKKWARGGKKGLAALLNKQGNRCCLGTLARNLCRVPLTKMVDSYAKWEGISQFDACMHYTVPSMIPNDLIHNNPQLIAQLQSFISTDEFDDLSHLVNYSGDRVTIEDVFVLINDDHSISDRERENLLTKYFKLLLDIDVRFVP